MTETLVIHNIPAPYRLPLFEELDDETDLKILFHKGEDETRKWNPSLEDYSFDYDILPVIDLKALWINYTIPFRILEEDPDRIIIGEYFFNLPSILSAVLHSKLKGSELVLWSGVLETEYSRSDRGLLKKAYSKIRSGYQRILYRFTDSYIAYCQDAKKYLVQRGAEEEDIHVGGQVMPEQLLPESSVEKEDTKYSDDKVVLSLGYLQKRKGIEYLIEAFRELEADDTKLVIAGSGPDGERLREIAGEDEDIEFVGHVKGERKAKYYTVADVFVLPTLHDPWGLVVNEALYYDNPVTVTESAGAKDIIGDGENGKVVSPKDPEATKSAIEDILDNPEKFEVTETWTSVEEGLKPFRKILEKKNEY